MPQHTERYKALQLNARKIKFLMRWSHLKMARDLLICLLREQNLLLENRYVSRPTSYVRNPLDLVQVRRRPGDFPSDKFGYRMTQSEFNRLLEMVGTHDVFNQGGPGRPQAHPAFQLAVYLHRLAHGLSLEAVSDMFSISKGSANNYCFRASLAIASLTEKVITWPTQEARSRMKREIFTTFGIPHCIGFVDGVHIVLDRSPSLVKEAAAGYFNRKGLYALLVLAACDNDKRFTFVHYGSPGASSDTRAQQSSALHLYPEQYFDEDEYLLGDSGFVCTHNVIAMYKKERGGILMRHKKYFNERAASARVRVEHSFGMLKMRWRLLRRANLRMESENDQARAWVIVLSAMVLHNLFIDSAKHYWSEQEHQDYLELDGEDVGVPFHAEMAAHPTNMETHRRRERLVYEMARRDTDLSTREFNRMFPRVFLDN